MRDELPTLINLAALVNDLTTVVDVGANVGLYTHTFRRLRAIYPALSIVAVEANPDTFARLSAVAYDGVTFLNMAASDHEGVLTFCDGAVSHVFTTIDRANSYNINSETVEVQARRLDSLSLVGNDILLKIDVEGQEMSVLQGASALFSANRIATVYIDGFSDQDIPEFLKKNGFRLRNGRSLEAFRENDFSLLATRTNPPA
ncbi:MAG: FkbM family methyltransferase [Casimicrobium sp.]